MLSHLSPLKIDNRYTMTTRKLTGLIISMSNRSIICYGNTTTSINPLLLI